MTTRDTRPAAARMPSDKGLADAAAALGVDQIVATELASSDRRHHLELAGAIIGRAEALAMVLGSPIAQRDPDSDPVEVLEDMAFRANGMRARNFPTTRALWSLWTARRLQHQIRCSIAEHGSSRLAAVAALLDSVNALLSAEVHRASGDAETAAVCAVQAHMRIEEARVILSTDV